jgi:predicted transcriptional regulator
MNEKKHEPKLYVKVLKYILENPERTTPEIARDMEIELSQLHVTLRRLKMWNCIQRTLVNRYPMTYTWKVKETREAISMIRYKINQNYGGNNET